MFKKLIPLIVALLISNEALSFQNFAGSDKNPVQEKRINDISGFHEYINWIRTLKSKMENGVCEFNEFYYASGGVLTHSSEGWVGMRHTPESPLDRSLTNYINKLKPFPTDTVIHGTCTIEWPKDIPRQYVITINLKKHSSSTINLYNKAVLLLARKEFDTAITTLSNVIKNNPKFPYAYIARGTAYKERGQREQALNDFLKAVDLSPNVYSAYEELGLIYDDLKQYKRAAMYYQKALSLAKSGFVCARTIDSYFYAAEYENISDVIQVCKSSIKNNEYQRVFTVSEIMLQGRTLLDECRNKRDIESREECIHRIRRRAWKLFEECINNPVIKEQEKCLSLLRERAQKLLEEEQK